MSQKINVLALNLAATVRFLRSVALARAMSETTHVEWKSYNDSTILNLVYTVLFWKEKPGWVEINTGKREKVLARTNELTKLYWQNVQLKLVHGPSALAALMRGYEQARNSSLENLRHQFEDAVALNNEVIKVTKHAITEIACIKLAADIIVKVTPGPVSLPYSVATTFIKEMDKAESANVVVFHVSKESLKEETKKLSEKGSHLLDAEAHGYQMALHNAEIDMARQNDLLRRGSATAKSISKAKSGLERAVKEAYASRMGARLSGAGHVALKGVCWGFVALDVYESWHDYTEAVGM